MASKSQPALKFIAFKAIFCLTSKRPYLYVREIARVDGKPKVVSQIYLGSLERVAGLASGTETDTLKIKVEEFGALWLGQQMDQDVDLASIVDEIIPSAARETGPSVGEYFLYCEPVSKRPLLLNLSVRLKFQSSKYYLYSCG